LSECVLRPQVGHERLETLIHRGPQALAMQRALSRMRVEAAVVAVEHARAEIGAMHLSDALQLAADRLSGYCTVGLVLDRRHLQDVRAQQ
jgi:antirestriction protein ArdC